MAPSSTQSLPWLLGCWLLVVGLLVVVVVVVVVVVAGRRRTPPMARVAFGKARPCNPEQQAPGSQSKAQHRESLKATEQRPSRQRSTFQSQGSTTSLVCKKKAAAGFSFFKYRQDMSEGCGQHGKLISVNIVKPHHAQVGVTTVAGKCYHHCHFYSNRK